MRLPLTGRRCCRPRRRHPRLRSRTTGPAITSAAIWVTRGVRRIGRPRPGSRVRSISITRWICSRGPAAIFSAFRPAMTGWLPRAGSSASRPTFRSRAFLHTRLAVRQHSVLRRPALRATPNKPSSSARCGAASVMRPATGYSMRPGVWPGATTNSPARSSPACRSAAPRRPARWKICSWHRASAARSAPGSKSR
jgi:hypothetical protein